MVEELLSAGPDVRAPTKNGSTPPNMASQFGQVAVIEKLLEAGADPSLVNKE